MSGERFALYGGSFNPPHVGHVLAIGYCLSCLPIDRVWMAPASRHAFGKGLVDFDTRMRLCQRAAEPFGARVFVSDVERAIGNNGRTINVVDHLLAEDPSREITVIVGADILDELDRWSEVDRLFSITHRVVLGREGFDNTDPRVFSPALPEVSSSGLREALSAGDLDGCRSLVPRRVLEMIEAEGLYLPPR